MFNGENEDIKELLNNLIRIGKVSSVDYQRGTARVTFPDDDEIVSYDLPVLHRNALKNKDYNMPDIDERVLCLFLPSGVATGFILGSVYTETVLPPESSGKYRTVVFDDGTRVRYDREDHHMSIDIGETKITANRGFVTVDAPRNISITAGNDVNVKANKLMVQGAMGASMGASGIISGASVATVQDGIIIAIQ